MRGGSSTLFFEWRKYIPIVVIVVVGVVSYVSMQQRDTDTDNHSNLMEDEIIFNDNEILELDDANDVPTKEDVSVVVDVKGAIKKPGVYEVDASARVHDVILLAGGLTEVADEKGINLAEKVYDEMVIFIPEISEDGEIVSGQQTNVATSSNDGKVRINSATIDELTTINGIGPAKAEAIISFREEHGPFQQMDDLLQVSGIGEKTLENIKDYIIVP